MGLFTLFMALNNGKGICIENLQVNDMPELRWGDTKNRWEQKKCILMLDADEMFLTWFLN